MLRHAAPYAAQFQKELGFLWLGGKTDQVAGPEGRIAVRDERDAVTPYGADQSP